MNNNAEIIEAWSDHLLVIDGLAISTVKNYRRNAEIALGMLPPIETLTQADIRAFIRRQHVEVSREVLQQRLAALKSLLRYAKASGVSADQVEMPHFKAAKRKLPRALSVEQCFALIDAEKARNDWIGLRNAALWTLMWGTGMRVSEALALTIRDAGEKRETLVVKGKGSKERMVPVVGAVWTAIDNYLTALADQPDALALLDDDKPLFVSETFKPLDQRDAQRAFASISGKIGLPEAATPHSLRHSFATHMLNRGANLRDVQELLGHESLSTTAIYATIANDKLVEEYESHHPRGLSAVSALVQANANRADDECEEAA